MCPPRCKPRYSDEAPRPRAGAFHRAAIRLGALGLFALGSLGCRGAPAGTAQAIGSQPVAEVAQEILEGPAKDLNEHLGHTLGPAIPWFGGANGLALPVAGGVKWDGMARQPSASVTRVGLFRLAQPKDAPDLVRRADLYLAGDPGDGLSLIHI